MKKKKLKIDTKILEKAEAKKKTKKESKTKDYLSKKQFWQALSVILAIMFVIALAAFFSANPSNSNPSKEQVKTMALNFVKQKLVSPGVKVQLLNFTEEKNVYKLVLKLTLKGQSQEAISYVTKSGELFFPQGIEIPKAMQPTKPASNTNVASNIPKSDKPTVDLFVMAYCPFGTQMEKAIIPTVKTLGKDINFNVKFVYYSMHGKKELDEQLTQYCIEKNYNGKYLDYLSCFLEDGNSTRCLTQVNLTQTDLSNCISSTDVKYNITGMYNDKTTWLSGRFPQFPVYKQENQQYGVQGSPTLVINGVKVNAERNSEALLKTICSAFNNQPKECQATLSSETPSPGFGYQAGSGSGSGSCS